MTLRIASLATGLLLILSILSCSEQTQNPIGSSFSKQSRLMEQSEISESSHYLWGYYRVSIDPEKLIAEIVPFRSTTGHNNVLKFLEQGPCTTCFKLAGITPNFDGTFSVNISIKHPFSNLNLTGFDVSGIVMFNGSHHFPTSGLVMPDLALGEGEVINADGYTSLYNSTTAGNGLEGYFPEKIGPVAAPSATLNGFKRFVTDNPANTRNAFYAGDEIIVTFEIDPPDPPNPLIFGYAVDSSWVPAVNKPVDDPINDFGLNANCPEPWKIVVTEEPIGDGLTITGGETKLLIDAYDWQGKTTHHDPLVECPELYDGSLTGTWVSDGPGYARYELNVANSKLAPIGEYRCLVSVKANENDPIAKPWLDLTAYQIVSLGVSNGGSTSDGGNLLWAKSAGGASGNDWGYGITSLPNNATIVSGWFEGTVTFGQAEANQTVLTSAGFMDVFIARYSSNGELTWAKRAGGADDERAYGIARLSDDSTVITGWFEGATVFGLGDPNQTNLLAVGVRDIFIARYDTDGALLWAKSALGSFNADDYGIGITDFMDDSIVVSGWYEGSVTFGPGEPGETTLTSAGGIDMFIARYDQFGSLVWAKSAGGAESDLSYAISKSGDVATVVTGYFSGTATFGAGEAGEDIITSDGATDMFIARFDVNGETAWASSAGGPSGDEGYAITVTDFSTIVTGGFMESATFGRGDANETVLTSDGGSDTFIASYNVSGNLNWAKSVGAPYDDYGYGVTTLFSDNSTVMTGTFAGSATFGSGEPNETILTAVGWDVFIARYNTNGTLAWAKYAEGASGTDEGYGITTLQDNSTVVTGFFVGSETFGKGEPNQTILTSTGYKDLFIARFNK
jgi:hypothetical protein